MMRMVWKRLLIFGDLMVVVLQGFYMGVGIWQSSGFLNVFLMTMPTLLVWLGMAHWLRLYANQPEAAPADSGRAKTAEAMKVVKLAVVWLSTSVFAVLWQTFYWDVVLKQDRGVSLYFTIIFCMVGIVFLAFWRCCWWLADQLHQNHILRIIARLGFILLLICQLPPLILTVQYAPRTYHLDEIEELPSKTALVLGAGVYRNGTASGVLRDRVLTAVDLYQRNLVDTILMSGSNNAESRFETDVMTALAIENGVLAEDILQDEVGWDTAFTCYNAKNNFALDQAVLVTQSFHVTRSLYTCDQYGVRAVSVSADRAWYNLFSWMQWYLRDWVGLFLTWVNHSFISS